MDFRSDNTAGVAPEIMQALVAASSGSQSAYGEDDYTQQLERQFGEVFEHEVAVFPVATGTAANALALAHLTPPWGSIYGHRLAHVTGHECGAAEFFSGGAKLVLLDGENGRFSAKTLSDNLRHAQVGVQHVVQPAAVSISQANDCGTLYRPSEIAALSAVCREYGLKLHMDGARFANAVSELKVSPADLTWRSGVDVMSFGATKNGAMAAEAVIFFDQNLAKDFVFRRKRAGHLFSKMRYLSVQLLAYLKDDLWLRNAGHANKMAENLAAGLGHFPGVQTLYPVEANQIFIILPERLATRLSAIGGKFYPWVMAGPDAVRLVTAFNTDPNDIVTVLTYLAE